MTNTTLLQHNSPLPGQTLDFLAQLGVPTVGLNALIYSGSGVNRGQRSARKRPAGLFEHGRANLPTA